MECLVENTAAVENRVCEQFESLIGCIERPTRSCNVCMLFIVNSGLYRLWLIEVT